MDNLLMICAALSVGVLAGGIVGGLREFFGKRTYTQNQLERGKKLWEIGSRIMTYLTCFFLALGFIWCMYFLLLGIFVPEQADYANNMSELIVAVLTVVSIVFAFYEFIRRK